MKNSALARVFAIVLAVMCVIMLLSGVYGWRKAVDEHDESLAYANRLTERIATFKELDEKLQNTVSYDEAYEELEKLQEDHDSDASQHRTDLATYSATKGGYTMGLNLIEYNKQVIADNKEKIAAGKPALAAGKAQLQQQEAAYLASKADIDQLIASANGLSASCLSAASGLDGILNLIQSEPAEPPDPGQAPDQVDAPTDPDASDYDQQLANYNEYLGRKQQWDDAVALKSGYPAAHGAWEQRYQGALMQVDTAALNSLLLGGDQILDGAAAVIPGSHGLGLSAGTVSTSATPAENAAALSASAGALNGEAAALASLSEGLSAIGPAIEAGKAALAEKEAELFSYELAIQKGEQELQGQLENIWYNLGELDKDEDELSEEKERLDKESDKLGKMLVSVEEKKELQDKHRSTKALLTNIDEIDAMVDAGGDVAESAETHLAQSSARAETLYTGRLVICALALLGGLSGFAGIPAAFEKTKKRFWLLFPVILCLACTCACDGINMYLGLGQMYAALFTAIFALIQLLIVLPKKKTVIQEPEPAGE